MQTHHWWATSTPYGATSSSATAVDRNEIKINIFSGCDDKSFDVSLWPMEGTDMDGGLENCMYNFQQVGIEEMMPHNDEEQLTAIGHSFGPPDLSGAQARPKT
ncbi:hypothetical protein PF004_g1144 [Phytophthora fragariae]|uniref:Uncharacterized protein n=3 Tax=Phytophthora TaxID=4783 RepID=A0A6A3J6M8_9STRA|nr:hypothetical protein PR002_g23197 [Phytophthora rubi]KAE8989407.1 hypothetical protein PR001_g21782 [Phytophthora rubi]KAE9254242.1 hypothetical protein PF004_g1144 [Phytophthora fragariae]